MSVRIPLSRGKFALVSDADAERVNQHKWTYDSNGYACRLESYRVDGQRQRRKVLLHRFILDAPNGYDVDHANGDKLDCRRHNLRVATRSQNMANSGPRRGLAYKGVYARRDRSTFRAEIMVNGVRRDLGSYRTAVEAARVYDQHALAAWGQFAWLNFPSALHVVHGD